MPPAPEPEPIRIATLNLDDLTRTALSSVLRQDARIAFVDPPLPVDHPVVPSTAVAVLVDVDMMDEVRAVRWVRSLADGLGRVVVWTANTRPYVARSLRVMPDVTVLDRRTPVAVLADALVASLSGTVGPGGTSPAPEDVRLSPQEIRVLTLFADGATMQYVGYRTGTTAHTVEDYVRRIRAKYHRAGRPAATKADLLKRALEDGYLPLPAHTGSSAPVTASEPCPADTVPVVTALGRSADSGSCRHRV